MPAKRFPLPMLALVYMLAVVGCASPDTDALISEALAIEADKNRIEANRDAAARDLIPVWDRVEKGPQMILNTHLDIANDQEWRGWTIEANKTREAAYGEFFANSLVVEAQKLSAEYERLDASWLAKNRALGNVLVEIQDAGATDQWRAAVLSQ